MLVLKGLGGLIEPFNFSFFSVTGWGIGLDHRDVEWFALEMDRDHSVVFESALKYCISNSFVDCIELLHFGCKEYNQSDFGVYHLVKIGRASWRERG